MCLRRAEALAVTMYVYTGGKMRLTFTVSSKDK
jgi:hypothetical protein